VLPARHRLHRSADFTAVLRGGARAPQRTLVLHHRAAVTDEPDAVVGLVVSKAVGNAVVRHRVSRRLRAQLAARLTALPPGSGTVVRALPPAAAATSAELGADLDRGLRRLQSRGLPIGVGR
jgi:ribonuclease P protein component